MRLNDVKIILASQSKTRQTMLKNAGVRFKAIKPVLDEREIARDMVERKTPLEKIAVELAKRKALTVAKKNPDALVIGSDQILLVDGKLMNKARNREEALEKLKFLRGKTHALISGVAVAKAETIFWSHDEDASLTMHNFNDEFLNNYADKAGDALINAVGAYEIEGAGAWLFSQVRGDHFTILGMPLLPLLTYLHDYHGAQP